MNQKVRVGGQTLRRTGNRWQAGGVDLKVVGQTFEVDQKCGSKLQGSLQRSGGSSFKTEKQNSPPPPPPPTPPPPKKMSLDFLTLICTHKPLVLLHIFCFHATNSAFYKCLPKIIVHRGPDSYVPAYCIGYSLEAMVASFLF